MKRLLITLIICTMCFCDAVPVMAASSALHNNVETENQQENVNRESDSPSENTQEQKESQTETSGDTTAGDPESIRQENASSSSSKPQISKALQSPG